MKYIELLETRIFEFEKWFNREIEYYQIQHPLVLKFLERILKKEFIKNNNPVPKNLVISKGTEWDKKDFENGTLISPYLTDEGQDRLVHVIDWLKALPESQYLQLRGIQDLDIAYEHANRYFAAKNKKASDIEDEEGREIVYKFKDGMFFAKLNSSQCLDREGKLMQHCVGSYADEVKHGNVVIYSLRDKKNQPHATLEARGKEVYQIKGKQNEAPVEKYIPYIKEFILNNDFDVKRDEENIELIRLNNKLYDLNDTSNWPIEINNGLDLSNMRSISLPDNFIINGDLYLSNTPITELPDNLTVNGNLYLNRTKITFLPRNLIFTRNLDISYTNIILPDNFIVPNNLIMAEYQHELPKNLTVNGSLNASGSKITYIPSNLKLGKSLYLNNSIVRTLPNNFKINNDLIIINGKIKELPDNLVVKGSLDIRRSPIHYLPKNLQVGGNLYIQGTLIYELPIDLKVNGKIIVEYSKFGDIIIPDTIKKEKIKYYDDEMLSRPWR